MKLVKMACAFLVACTLLLTTVSEGVSALANTVGAQSVTVLQNDFIKITVDNGTGRYGIRTVDGQPIRKNDQNVNLMFQGDDPETSFTTFKINGTDYIFGNPYKFAADFFSETTKPVIVQNKNGTKQIETIWKIKGVQIKQILMLYTDAADKVNAGNVDIRYEVLNNSGARVELGSRILLDTMVGGNDGPEFQIGTAFKAPLMVERKLVHEPGLLGIPVEDQPLYTLPAYWVMRDKMDPQDPQATNVAAYGFNNAKEAGINIVDEMIVGHWNGLANTKWDYTPNPNLDFTRDTNDYGTADSAVAFYWNPAALESGASTSFETIYGLGEIIEPDKVFSIRYLDPVQQLATLPDGSGYADDGIFEITAEIENLAMYNMEHSAINAELTLQGDLNFIDYDKDGKPVVNPARSKLRTLVKEATPYENEHAIDPVYKPGDTTTVSFTVQAKGKAWPTTRQYMLSVSSPETEAKLSQEEAKDHRDDKGNKVEAEVDDGLRAQYVSTKSGFILLPAIGEAVPTYAYGLSPKELYSSDVKYVTVNLSNIEAYNTGSETTDPNFDLFLREKVTGKRYKIPVKTSVVLQPKGDGSTGDMRITYRGGDLVDAGGNVIQAGLGPELPLGEYQVELDFKGDTGGDEEIAAMYDITTKQSFLVTDNQATRVREAGILAIYKQYIDLSHVTASVDGPTLDKINEGYPGEPFKAGTDLYSAVMAYTQAKAIVGVASKALDPKFKLDAFMDAKQLEMVPAYSYKLFASEQELNDFFSEKKRNQLVVIRGMIKQVGTGDQEQIVVDTKTEPAIINESVAYSGKDMVFVKGKLDVFGLKSKISDFGSIPFFNTLTVKGDGTLSVANSGFIFHKGEWTLDFFNGFNKSLGEGYLVTKNEKPDSDGNGEDDSLNGNLSWATGPFGDRLNPLRQIMIQNIYFNKQSLFVVPSFNISGFTIQFNDFILRPGGVSFGGSLSMKIVKAEIDNVVFNDKGFVGIDAALKFGLNQDIGMIGPPTKDDSEGTGGEISITHYVQDVPNISNRYGLKFQADLKNMAGVQVELSLKKVKDGRILPDVIGFGATLGNPGILITGGTYLTAIRGAVRELADTIAGGTAKDPFPLIIQAGVGLRFGISPAYFFGDVDLTLKRTGIRIDGRLDYSSKPDADGDDRIPMLTKALLEAQWVTPWFVRVETEVDVGGWDVIIGKAGIYVGQNLVKNRTDFEGYIGAKLQVPNDVPIVGGMPLSSVYFGVNNDKVWGSVGVLLITLGVTYYWGGGVEFGTSSEQMPDGLVQLRIDDPERGPRLMVIGQGVETLATSWLNSEQDTQAVVYREVEKGINVIENGASTIGVGGITTKNGGRVHTIPMNGVSGNAVIEVEYDSAEAPTLTLKDAGGKLYPLVFDNSNTNPNANAFSQALPVGNAADKVYAHKTYIIVPADKVKNGGDWTLTAPSPVQSRLLNVPVAAGLNEVKLTKSGADANAFTASWKAANVKEGDTVSLYLAKDAVTTAKTTLDNGQEVLEPGDPGLLIAKDLPVDKNGSVSGGITSGSTVIDVTKVPLLGDVEDIRGLLQQGDYYLRAELKSDSAYATKTSAEKFEIVDPLAPASVGSVVIEPAGNGLFSLSFKPAAKKPGNGGFEHSYVIEALTEQGGKLESYPNFGELMYTEEELAPYWNAASGKYEGILLGGWNATTTDDTVNTDSLNGTVPDPKTVDYVGLETGQEYVIGVSSVTKPTADKDKNENYHYAARTDSVRKLLPVPAKPKLTVDPATKGLGATTDYIELLTNATEQSIALSSDQKDVQVEAFYDDQSIGKLDLTNGGAGSKGTLHLDRFKTDGPYAIELRATNRKTGDLSVTMLYLTVDTLAPVLYLDAPVTGARTEQGQITVKGTTSNDAVLTVNGTVVAVADNGSFESEVPVVSKDATVELVFLSKDGAGNANTATVSVTNDSFQAPAALVLKEIPAIKPGETRQIQASLKLPDGKDPQGKLKFREVPITDRNELEKLSYSVSMGDTAAVTDGGAVTATGASTGANLIQGTYRVNDDVTLEAMVVANVAYPAPVALDTIKASTAVVAGADTKTRVSVIDPGDMTGMQLVYKVFKDSASAALPGFKEEIGGWEFLPADGIVTVSAGNAIVVAKRTSLDKLAMGASGKLSAKVSAVGGGIGGIGGIGSIPIVLPGGDDAPVQTGPSEATLNGQKVEAVRTGNAAELHVSAKDVKEGGAADIVIASQDKTIRSFKVRIDRDVVQQTAAGGRTIRIDLPAGHLDLPAGKLKNMTDELVVTIGDNSAADQNALSGIALNVRASMLGAGEGVTVAANLPQDAWLPSVPARLAVPQGIAPGDITAVVQMGADGSWTTLPWKPSAEAGYVNVNLTGEGHVVFLRNEADFRDVSSGFWGKASIAEAAAKLFVLGKGAGSFDPNSEITRAEYPTILLRVAGFMNKRAAADFSDVGEASWYSRSVAIAAELGIVTGMPDGSYGPKQTLSRIEGMAMVGRMLDVLGIGEALSDEETTQILAAFGDNASIPAWARKPAALTIKNGIILGDNNRVNPSGELTRAQAAAIAIRLDRLITED